MSSAPTVAQVRALAKASVLAYRASVPTANELAVEVRLENGGVTVRVEPVRGIVPPPLEAATDEAHTYAERIRARAARRS